MGFPLFRFTLNNTIAGAQVISEPGGWDQAVLKLTRHEEYHSLVELYDQQLVFYGTGTYYNGGYDYIKSCETQGPDVQITILIEISENQGTTYSTAFTGLLDITSIKEVDFYKLECGILRDDFWQKFINRKGTPVDLSSTTDLDGNAITGVSPITFSLPSQKIRRSFTGTVPVPLSFTSTGTELYYMIDNQDVTLDEIKTRNALTPNIFDSPTPDELGIVWYEFEYNGDYTFNIRIEVSSFTAGIGSAPGGAWRFIVHRKDGTSTGSAFFTSANFTSAPHTSTVYTFTSTLSFIAGDQILVYGEFTPLGAGDTLFVYGNYGASSPAAPSGILTVATYFNITADTTYADTTASVFNIADSAKTIIGKETGTFDCLSSSYLIGGCGSTYNLMKGLHVRGYSLASKPFTMSFDDWWAGSNPMFNLGLGYDSGKIRIEQKSYFYDATPVVNLDYVNFIERGYDAKRIFKSIEIGYEKWSAESDSGVDDPQTKHTYRTRFKTIGEDTKILSKFYAASLGIEQTRRNQAEAGKDWRLDEEIMIIAHNLSDPTIPELDENFISVSNLINSDTRYNIRITPGRNFHRWRNFFNGSLAMYSGENFYFASGEGNITMQSDYDEPDCDAPQGDEQVNFAENQDIFAGSGHTIYFDNTFLFIPTVYDFEHPLTYTQYSTIVANRTKAVGVSRTASGHVPCHIMNLEYDITHGKGKFTVILGQTTPIS